MNVFNPYSLIGAYMFIVSLCILFLIASVGTYCFLSHVDKTRQNNKIHFKHLENAIQFALKTMDLNTAKALIEQYEQEYSDIKYNSHHYTHPFYVSELSWEKTHLNQSLQSGWVIGHWFKSTCVDTMTDDVHLTLINNGLCLYFINGRFQCIGSNYSSDYIYQTDMLYRLDAEPRQPLKVERHFLHNFSPLRFKYVNITLHMLLNHDKMQVAFNGTHGVIGNHEPLYGLFAAMSSLGLKE